MLHIRGERAGDVAHETQLGIPPLRGPQIDRPEPATRSDCQRAIKSENPRDGPQYRQRALHDTTRADSRYTLGGNAGASPFERQKIHQTADEFSPNCEKSMHSVFGCPIASIPFTAIQDDSGPNQSTVPGVRTEGADPGCGRLIVAAIFGRLPMTQSESMRPSTESDKEPIGTVLISLFGIAAIAVAGNILGHLLGPPKAFFLIVVAMTIWVVGGWFLGGWRAVMAGLAALTAALTASDGSYAMAFVFSCMAFLFLFAKVSPRNRSLRPESLH